MKTCTTCGTTKPCKQFQVRRASHDGRTASCKSCLKLTDAKRDMLPHRVAMKTRYQKTKAGKASIAKTRAKYCAQYPERRAAHTAVGNAVRDGKLLRPKLCETCGQERDLQGHHHDYAKPLSVHWLCVPCHIEQHRPTC